VRGQLHTAATVLVLGVVAVLAGPTAAHAAGTKAPPSLLGPYFGAPFKVTSNRYSFGQAPSWTADGQVLSTEFDSAGINQIYRSKLDGSRQQCLTCSTVKGPNGLPQARPQGDWIMFESYGQQPTHTGNPGLGGYGGDIYVMRADGSHPYRLTTTTDPDNGAQYTPLTGVPYDNFHAYWSPNGKQVIWTHTEAHPLSEGGQTWSIMLGDFVVSGGVPSLQNVRVVGKPYGAYETQPWAPDGSGFLFSAAGGLKSPFQATNPGWGHMQLYFMRLYGRGASPSNPQVTQISDDTPAYQEQAIFTPDMKTVIMMSNRAAPQGSWYDLIVSAAMRTGYDALNTGTTQTLQFLSDFIGPDFYSNLYAVDVRTKAIRQLTSFHGVVPEFYWDEGHSRIILGLGVRGPTVSWQTWIGRFAGITAKQRRVPKKIPAPGLYGQPVEMTRVGAQAQPIRDPGPTNNASVAVPAPSNPAPALPHAAKNTDKPSVPAATATYLPVWLGNLLAIYGEADSSFASPPLLGAVAQFG
jgi:hypothetical protein